MAAVLVTGGAGFIGSALVRQLIAETDLQVVNFDALTYAGNLDSLGEARDHPRHSFERADVCDAGALRRVLAETRPTKVFHLAAESHVDRSIDAPAAFIQTNFVGTFTLLQETLEYWKGLAPVAAAQFRLLHVSTDEVFGSLGGMGQFTESTPYDPSSPYAASKAGSDHLARAWRRTYGLPVVVTNCSNNYGPYQFPEKLIPLMIQQALEGKPLPVYGKGENVRDWLYVEDHVRAIRRVAEAGRPGETYNVGANNERRNLDVVRQICALLDRLSPSAAIGPRDRLIQFVADRPGHDLRYAIDGSKLREELGWQPQESFHSGLERTVSWYLEHQEWVERVRSGAYRGERLGLGSVT